VTVSLCSLDLFFHNHFDPKDEDIKFFRGVGNTPTATWRKPHNRITITGNQPLGSKKVWEFSFVAQLFVYKDSSPSSESFAKL
jgi:hypothetical protein